MTNFIIIFLCFILGVLLKNVQRFPRSSSLTINLFIIYISLPALILNKFPPLLKSLNLTGLWWVPISMAWITFILSWILISHLGRKLNWSRAKTGALILTAGLGNTSFVGFPLLAQQHIIFKDEYSPSDSKMSAYHYLNSNGISVYNISSLCKTLFFE